MSDNDDKFDWLKDQSVLIKPVQAVAMYTNKDGDVVIRQEADGFLFHEDPFVVIPMIDLQTVIDALTKIRDDQYE